MIFVVAADDEVGEHRAGDAAFRHQEQVGAGRIDDGDERLLDAGVKREPVERLARERMQVRAGEKRFRERKPRVRAERPG